MEEMNVKIFLTKNNTYYLGDLVPNVPTAAESSIGLTFKYLFMLVPQEDKIAMVPFGSGMSKDYVVVNKDDVFMMADVADSFKKEYENAVGNIKAARANIQLAPASALKALDRSKANQRPDVQKLI